MKKTLKIVLLASILVFTSLASFLFGQRVAFMKQARVNVDEKDLSVDGEKDTDHLDYSRISDNIEGLEKLIDSQYLNKYSKDDLEEGIYKGMLQSLKDPYSVYYDEEEFKSLNEDSSGSFGGVGLQVGVDKSGHIEVVSPIKGTPAEKAGIKTGDRITHINDKAYMANDLENAVKAMRGKAGEKVKVTVTRGEKNEKLDFDLTRAIINVESVHPQMLEGNIGYILVSSFQERTDVDFEKAVKDLKAKGATKLILDLRNNPGGLLDVTLKMADFLMDEGVVISVRDKNGRSEDYKTKDGSEKIQMVTLINGGSASASEVMSGALQDNKRSIIVGEKSYGKGVIQQLYPMGSFEDGEGLKLTIAEFYTPKGHKIHGKGISPDYEVKIPEGVKQIGVENLKEDTQLQKAIELLK